MSPSLLVTEMVFHWAYYRNNVFKFNAFSHVNMYLLKFLPYSGAKF